MDIDELEDGDKVQLKDGAGTHYVGRGEDKRAFEAGDVLTVGEDIELERLEESRLGDKFQLPGAQNGTASSGPEVPPRETLEELNKDDLVDLAEKHPEVRVTDLETNDNGTVLKETYVAALDEAR